MVLEHFSKFTSDAYAKIYGQKTENEHLQRMIGILTDWLSTHTGMGSEVAGQEKRAI